MTKKSIRKNAVLNVIKVLASVVFPLITFPYATRVLGAENLGKVQFSSSFVSYFALIAALGIATYGVREGAACRHDKKEFEKFANQVFTINVISMIISYVLMFVVLLFPTKLVDYRTLILIQSLTMFFTTLGVDWIYGAQEDFLYITIRGVLVQIISLVLMLLLVKNDGDYYIYALTIVIANAGASVFNFLHARKYCKLRLVRDIQLRRHIKPLLTLFASAVAVNIYINSDYFMLGLMTTDEEVGVYSAAVKVYSVVKALINAVIAVTIPQLVIARADIGNKEKYYELSSRILKISVLLFLPAMAGLIGQNKEIIALLAGSQYMAADMPLAILAVSLIFAVLSNYFVNAVLIVNKKEKHALIATIMAAVFNVVLNLFFIPWLGCIGAAITTLLSELLVMAYSLVIGWGDFGKNKVFMNLVHSFVGSFVVLGVCLLVRMSNLGNALELVVSIMAGGVSYFAVLFLLRNKTIIELFYSIMGKMRRKR